MYCGSEDEAVKDVLKEVIDMLCPLGTDAITMDDGQDAKVRDRFC